MKINVPNIMVGVFVSGGLDSALLYHLLLKEHDNVVPLLVFRNSDQQQYALNVIKHTQSKFGSNICPIFLKSTDVKSGIAESLRLGFKLVYVGVTRELDEFLVGWESNNFRNTQWCQGPFSELDKSQVVDLVRENNLEELFLITHTCAAQSQGRCLTCNRCRERAWAFSRLGLTDPGTL